MSKETDCTPAAGIIAPIPSEAKPCDTEPNCRGCPDCRGIRSDIPCEHVWRVTGDHLLLVLRCEICGKVDIQ